MNRKLWQSCAAGLAIVALVATAGVWLGDLLDREWIDSWIRARGAAGIVLFTASTVLLASVGFSRQAIAFLAGYGFGLMDGVLISLFSAAAACALTFFTARYVLRDYLVRRFRGRIGRLHAFIRDNTFSVTLVFRLLPLGSNWLLNVAAGAGSVRVVPFLSASVIGYLPQMIVFALLGSGVQVPARWQLVLAVLLFVGATALGFLLYRRYLCLSAASGCGQSLSGRRLPSAG